MSKLGSLKHNSRKALNKYTDALKAGWPKGTVVEVYLRHGQTLPTEGVVISHYAGEINVRLNTPARLVRRFAHTEIVFPPPKPNQ